MMAEGVGHHLVRLSLKSSVSSGNDHLCGDHRHDDRHDDHHHVRDGQCYGPLSHDERVLRYVSHRGSLPARQQGQPRGALN